MFRAETMKGLPEYHDDLLLVRRQLSRVAAPAAVAGGPLVGPLVFSTLAMFERAGVIKRIIPLDGKPELPILGTTVALSTSDAAGASLLGDASILELEEGADQQAIRLALANDPGIIVSRVPVRYLVAKKSAKKKAAARQPTAQPPAAGSMWNLKKIKWQTVHDNWPDLAAEIRVAVLDTGIDPHHPDLPGQDMEYVYDFPDGPALSSQDIVGHGTHVAGTIRAMINNDVGVNGICECLLSCYKIFGDDPRYLRRGSYFTYVVDPIAYFKALAACIDSDVQVVNLSIGGYGTPSAEETLLFDELISKGVAVVAAMGNDDTSDLSYPAAIPGVIAVGATSIDDRRANFSNRGPHIALCAPGVGIWSTVPTYPGQHGFWPVPGQNPPIPGAPIPRETDYADWKGTSMAAPHVAAAAALALAKHGALSAGEMRELLTKSVDKVPGMEGRAFTSEYGSGRLNLSKI